ncbi:adenine-specific methyltransferase EcoRI family protein [Brevibacterium sp. SMBL_HHYL_HB1]|jgi:hypothetical protein|uniref:adenine-specific methyltransferase EcoRI family protein n=1 Tax=Brevibacterium sp. SMBL_HHYL_HB1 TaxID=2777556 RepID=UPI001BA91C6F|nr:adenine-specific methyltransferase EcoRI family protein [Brevibacterium sp. SMBL_HHYL_HB1]QUL78044.1 DNA methyltransferase [Brevibacterium sp. SMBL_HHYL_HB1]
MANTNLGAAKQAKNNEYYTQWPDIEREMNACLEYDPDVFRDATVLLPCDDPEWSNFTKFFALHFRDFGLKKLISTSYAPNSNADAMHYSPTLFETEDPKFDPKKSKERGRVFVLEQDSVNGDGRVDIDDLRWDYLEGDGDFSSAEVTALRDEADFVITNPPFSLFRKFLSWLFDGKVRFSIIGSNNAITYKETFLRIKNNQMWLGATGNSNDMVFGVPKGTPVKKADREKAERLGYPSDDRFDYTRMGNSCWLTSIEHGRRHEPLQLMDMKDNLQYGSKRVKAASYQSYENYDAIEVPETMGIPSDFEGIMGVPISFLDKYDPEQFEILMMANGNARTNTPINVLESVRYHRHSEDKGGLGVINGERVYARILVRHLNPVPRKE